MSTMAFSTLQAELASMLRLDVNNVTHATLLKRWLNLSEDDVHSRHDWPWALDREVVQTVIDKEDGTVSVSAGGQTVTGASTAFDTTLDVGKFIQFSGSNDWYKITAVASATSLTIEAPYVGTSALSAGTYKIRQVFYSVSASVEKMLTARQTVSPVKLELVHHRALDQWRPHQTASGNPIVYVLWGYDSSNRWTFTLDPIPDSVMNIEVRFKKKRTDLSAATDVSAVPEKWKGVVIDGALARGYEYVRKDPFDANDKRAEQALGRFERGLDRMIADADPESDWAPQLRNPDVGLSVQNILNLPSKYGR